MYCAWIFEMRALSRMEGKQNVWNGQANGECSKARSESEKENMKLEVRKRKASGQRSYKLGKQKANGN